MSQTGLVISDRYLEHDTGPHHPERPERLRAIWHRLELAGLVPDLDMIPATAVEPSLIEPVHPPEYISRFRYACEKRAGFIDTPECPVQESTLDIACVAAGGVVNAAEAVFSGRVRNAFCAVRPPGHHAERRRAMGFCYLNNIAIAAEYLRSRHEVERIAIVDWDVHHGNGTQHHFERDANVMFCSIHEDPHTLYPGTGFEHETGVGTTVNVPMAAGSGDEDYRRSFEKYIIPRVRAFRPAFILVSAGFDGHADDPLAHMCLSAEGFAWLTRHVVELANDLCEGRLVSVLEGGYELNALADSAEAHVQSLMM